MGARLGRELCLTVFLAFAVASGCYSSYKVGDRNEDDAGTGRDDVSPTLGMTDARDESDTEVTDDAGGRGNSPRRDSGRRDSDADLCDSVVLPSTVPISIVGNTRGRLKQLEPSCAARGAPERTFVFQPAIAGRYQIDTVGSDFDTVLYILDGDCKGSERFCNNDIDDSTHALIDLWLDAGETITIVIDGASAVEQGRFVLNINRLEQECGNGIIDGSEACDGQELQGADCVTFGFESGSLSCRSDCTYDVSMCVVDTTGGTGGTFGQECDSIDLGSAVPQSVSGSTDSRPNQLEPSCVLRDGSEQSYLFQAERDGYYTFDTNGSDFDTVLYLLEGDCTGKELICNDDSDARQSSVTVFLSEQQLVTVVVDGFDGAHGSFVLNIGYRENEWVCGNGIIESPEQCDGDDFGGLSCASHGYEYGSLYCDPISCAIDSSDCYDVETGGTSGGGGSAGVGGSGGSGGEPCVSFDLGSTVPQTISGDTSDLPDNLNSSCVPDDGPEQGFTFTAPQSTTYVIDMVESHFDTVLSVRRGDCYGTEIVCDDDSDGLISRVSLSLNAGETVTIVVAGYGEDAGFFVLNINRTEDLVGCGDGVIQEGEQCDAGNLGGATCRSLGYQGGWLFCSLSNCSYDVSMCDGFQTGTGSEYDL